MFVLIILIIDLYFLIPVIIKQIFNPISELVIPIGILIKEAKSEMETGPVSVGIKLRKFSIYFQTLETFLCFSFINSF